MIDELNARRTELEMRLEELLTKIYELKQGDAKPTAAARHLVQLRAEQEIIEFRLAGVLEEIQTQVREKLESQIKAAESKISKLKLERDELSQRIDTWFEDNFGNDHPWKRWRYPAAGQTGPTDSHANDPKRIAAGEKNLESLIDEVSRHRSDLVAQLGKLQ